MLAESDRAPLEVDGRLIQTDHLGYLLDPGDWTERVAEVIAKEEGVDLGEEHWIMVRFVRDWYAERRAVPEVRHVLKAMRSALSEDRATRRYLHRLFPYGYGPQVCKIAGMTMPRKVMLDV